MDSLAPIEWLGISVIAASGILLLWQAGRDGYPGLSEIGRAKLRQGYVWWGIGALVLAAAVTVGPFSPSGKLVLLAVSVVSHVGGWWNVHSAKKTS